MSNPRNISFAALGALVIFALGGASAEGAGGPHIGVQPRSAMVNSTVTLKGARFPANSSIELVECSATSWLVPEEPCDTSNAITVTSGPTGRFTAPFTVQLCPRTVPPKPPVTRERCYIGERLLTGEDTEGLLGATRITVTYP
jgi:hypothetical protein